MWPIVFVPFWELLGEIFASPHRSRLGASQKERPNVSLSKIDYYLLDNQYAHILSQTKGVVKEKRDGGGSGSKLGILGGGVLRTIATLRQQSAS